MYNEDQEAYLEALRAKGEELRRLAMMEQLSAPDRTPASPVDPIITPGLKIAKVTPAFKQQPQPQQPQPQVNQYPGVVTLPWNSNKTNVQTSVSLPIPPEVRKELRSETNQARGEEGDQKLWSFMAQKDNVNFLRGLLDKYNNQPPAAEDPRAAFIGAAQLLNTPRGESPDLMGVLTAMQNSAVKKEAARRDMIEKISAQLQRATQGAANTDVNFGKSYNQPGNINKTTQEVDSGLKTVVPSIQKNSAQMPTTSRAFRDIQKEFERNTAKFNQSIDYANSVDAFLKNTGPGQRLTQKAIEPLLARASSEVGNLSTYEQVGKTEARDIIGRLSQALSTLVDSELTQENKAAILDLVKQYRNVANSAIDIHKQISADRGAAAYGNLGLNSNDFKKALPTRSDYTTTQPIPSEQDQKALKFIKDNPNHPNAEKIKEVLRRKGVLK
jgi:hypothetical protein